MQRKKLLAGILAMALAVTGLPAPQLYASASEVAPQDDAGQQAAPVLELKFEDDLEDSSANGVHVEANNGAVAYTDGKIGRAVSLNGSTSLNLGTNGSLSPSEFTLSFWIKPNAAMTGEQTITWNKTEYNKDGWYLITNDQGMDLSVGPGGSQPYMLTSAPAKNRKELFPEGEWTHIAVTYDSDAKTACYYQNGTPVQTTVKHALGDTSTGVVGPCETDIKTIGYNGPIYKSAYLNASLDEYRLYDGVLGAEDIVAAYEEGGAAVDKRAVAQSFLDGLEFPVANGSVIVKDIALPTKAAFGSVVTWTSSEPEFLSDDGKVLKRPALGDADQPVTLTASTSYAGGEAVTKDFSVTIKALTEGENPSLVLDLKFEDNLDDSSVYASAIQAEGPVSYGDGVVNKAVSLNGNTYLKLGTSGMLSPAKMSLSFWLKPNADMAGGEQVIAWSKGTFNSDGWYLSSENGDTPLALSVGPASGQPYKIAVAQPRSEFFPAAEWTHVLVTYDSDTKECMIYRNGIPQKTTVKSGLSETASGVVGAYAGEKVIGSNGPVYGHSSKLNALLDEYRLYDKVVGLEDAISFYEESGQTVDRKAVAEGDLSLLNIPETATSKITLLDRGESGSVITWGSTDEDTIALDGTVTRPESGIKPVTLTATAVFANGTPATRSFTVTVKPRAQKNPDLISDSGIANIMLADDYLANASQKEIDYLLSLNSKKFLYEFYRVSGLTPPTSEGYQGWERSNAVNFRGHTFGHYMSALSQAYSGAEDAETKAKLLGQIRDAVEGLKVCQDAYAAAHPASAGYVSAFRESILNAVDGSGSSDENVIVPWYNLHKVLAGLIDIYTFVDDEELAAGALGIAESFSEYVYNRCIKLQNNAQMLRTEYGGMNEALYEIYDITGNSHFKTAAQYFDEVTLFDSLARGEDVLDGKHANTTIPKLTGALKRYTVLTQNEEYQEALSEKEKGELEKYKTAAINFWDIVVDHHTYITGGNSQSEHFHAADKLYADATKGDYDGSTTCETCNTYNMLKLTRELFKLTKDKKYMDYYENTYINAILSSQNPETGTTMYFQPMAPGYNKVFNRPFDEFWCCTGTGMENFSKLGDTIYFTEKSDVYVNMYFSNTFTFEKQNLKLTQQANIPNQDEVTITVAANDGADVADGTNLKLRIPDWVAGEPSISLNGTKLAVDEIAADGYATVPNVKDGDTIQLTFPMEVRAYGTQDNKDFVAFRYGPVALSAALGTNNIEASSPNGILVRVGTKDTSCKTAISVQNMTVDEWMADVKKNLVRIDDSEDGKVQFQLKNTDSPELIYTPHFMRYQERYGLYMTFEEAGSQASQDRIRARKLKLREEEMAIDELSNFDENNSEFAKNLKRSDNSSAGSYAGRLYRDAKAGGWFSYDMQVNPDSENNYLRCTWYSGDKGRSFEIHVNGEKLTDVTINDAAGSNTFYTDTFEVPEKYWGEPNYKLDSAGEFVLDENGEKIPVINVKFQSNGGLVGGLYGISTTDATAYDTDPSLSGLSFDTGKLSPAFSGETRAYTLAVDGRTEAVDMKITPHTPSGLVFMNDILIDDSVERKIALNGDETAVTFTATAQDHETSADYTVTVVKSSQVPSVDLSELNKKIEQAEGIEKGNYTDESYQTLLKAIEDAKKVAGNPETTQAKADKAKEDLQKAIDGLRENEKPPVVVPADKTGLEGAIQAAEAMRADKEKYTTESWSKVETALETAIAVNKDEKADQQTVDRAKDDLNNAIKALVEKKDEPQGTDKTDFAALNQAIADAKKYKPGDYTSASFKFLQKALQAAEETAKRADATQTQVDSAKENLLQAVKGLVKLRVVSTKKVTLGVKEIYSVAGKSCTYTTSNSKVASVNARGSVTAKKTGSATIKATDASGKVRVYKITVKKAPKKISVSPSKKTLNKGKKVKLKVKLPKGSAGSYTFKSNKPKVAAVNKKGVVTAKKKGTAKITVKTYNGKKKTVTIKVK